MILLVFFVAAFNPSQLPHKHNNDDFNHGMCATAHIFVLWEFPLAAGLISGSNDWILQHDHISRSIMARIGRIPT